MYKGKHSLLKEKIEEINQTPDNLIFNRSDLIKVGHKEYSINSSELKNLINKTIRERTQAGDYFYTTFDTIYFKEEPQDFSSPYGLKLYLWIAIKKDKLYQIAKESIERYGSGMLNFKDKPTIISAVSLKRQYPNTFSDVSEEKFKEIYEAEGEEERKECNEFIELRNSASREINEKRSYKIGDYNYFLIEEELGLEYLELFFNDTCNCERPNYYEHLLTSSDCLKTKEQIREFKNKVLEIMDRKIQENREKAKEDKGDNNSSNNEYPPNFNNNHDPLLGDFKNTACQEIIKKGGRTGT